MPRQAAPSSACGNLGVHTCGNLGVLLHQRGPAEEGGPPHLTGSPTTKWVTEKPFLIAFTPNAAARWLLPTPGGPGRGRWSSRECSRQVASASICRRSTRGWKLQIAAQDQLQEPHGRELLAGGLLDELRETARRMVEAQGDELGGDGIERDGRGLCPQRTAPARSIPRGRSAGRRAWSEPAAPWLDITC